MGLQVVPAFIKQVGYQHPAELMRNMTEAMFGSHTGATRYGDLKPTVVPGALQLQVSGGGYFLLGGENSQQGGYFVWSDGSETIALPSPPASSRIDSLILRVVDTQYGSDPGSPRAEWSVVQGVVSGTPTARADSYFQVGGSAYKPGAWARVADYRINSGDTQISSGNLTWNPLFARCAGVTICTSTTRPTDAVIGDRIYETNTKRWMTYDGVFWTNQPGTLVQSLSATPNVLNQDTLNGESNAFSTGWTPPHTGQFRAEIKVPYWGANGGPWLTISAKVNGSLGHYQQIQIPSNSLVTRPMMPVKFTVTGTGPLSSVTLSATGKRRTGTATSGGDNWNSSADTWEVDIYYVGP